MAAGGWWLHLRRCAGCPGTSAAATTHRPSTPPATRRRTGHQVIQSFEPGEAWFYDYRSERVLRRPELSPPDSHPLDQGVPGPRRRGAAGLQSKLNP